VKVFTEEMGKIAIRRIVEMIREKTQLVFTVHLPVELIVRASSASRVPSPSKRKTPISLTRRPRGPAIAEGREKNHGA